MRFPRLALLLLVAFLIVQRATAAEAATPAMRRIAVLVGSNDPPPGRQALRFAHDDATELGAVLKQVGGFAPSDVHVLLDPSPSELLASLDAVARTVEATNADVLFVFYYSGHSDGQALFPHGEPISVSDVRNRVEKLGARIRVGILDTCRGGSWTQSKGLSVGPPLAMADLLNVDTEGTALVSSSSGLENAHEADAVHGSFFTHYFAAGLRGAADRRGDGNITLQEAYDYARERTVQDSARLAQTPQHPSFDLALRGRQDIVLSVLSSSTSLLQVTAARAPIEIIQLPSGVTVGDAPNSQTQVRIAVPPGRYLVRSVIDGRVYTKEVLVRDGETATVADAELAATGSEKLAMKGDTEADAPLGLWTPPKGTHWLLHLGAGLGSDAVPPANVQQNKAGEQTISSFTGEAELWYRITDRLSWSVPWPAFSYRFGKPGAVEVMPYVGLAANSYNSSTGLSLGMTGKVAARIWTTKHQWILLEAGLQAPAYEDSGSPLLHLGLGHQLEPYGEAGYGVTIKKIVSLYATVGLDRDYSLDPPGVTGWDYEAEWLRVKGGMQVRLTSHVGLDLDVGWSTELHDNVGSYPGFMLGTTVAF
jgi:Caspase domain